MNVLKGVDTFDVLSAKYKLNPKDVPTVTELARKWDTRYDEAKALALFKEVLALDPDGKLGTTEYDKGRVACTEYAEYSIASSALYNRKAGGPAPLKAFIAKYPSGPLSQTSTRSLAGYFMNAADSKEAFAFLKEAAAKYPDQPFFKYYYLMRANQKNENVDEALDIAEKLSGFDPMMLAAVRVELLSKKGDQAKVEAAFGDEVIQNYLNNTAYNLRSYANFWIKQNKNLESAERALRTAIQLQPEQYYFRQTLADYYLKAGKTAEALAVFGPEFLKTPKLTASTLAYYARFWAQKKQNLDSASAALDQALAAEPDDSYVRMNAATVFIAMGKPDKALQIYGPAYAKTMEDEYELTNYGSFWARQKTNLEDALAAALKAVKTGESSIFWANLSDVYEAIGRLEDARTAAKTALERDEGYNTDYYKTQLKKIEDAIAAKNKK